MTPSYIQCRKHETTECVVPVIEKRIMHRTKLKTELNNFLFGFQKKQKILYHRMLRAFKNDGKLEPLELPALREIIKEDG